mmetsp:Transcript_65670/g.132161  ORF Transcript_65670/g.132161 Transcript_65670/m.132161 type:complete len:118 (-) Transcript_65670:340-693(-)
MGWAERRGEGAGSVGTSDKVLVSDDDEVDVPTSPTKKRARALSEEYVASGTTTDRSNQSDGVSESEDDGSASDASAEHDTLYLDSLLWDASNLVIGSGDIDFLDDLAVGDGGTFDLL